jgi:hypothetical protein
MKKEHTRNIVIATTNKIPVAGGFIDLLLDKYLPNEFERRKNDLIENFSNDLEIVKNKISLELFESPDFISVYMKLFRRAIEENRKEKIHAFRNILINSVTMNDVEFDETSFFIRLVSDLTIDQIRILHFCYNGWIPEHLGINKENNIYEVLGAIWPRLDEYYLQVCVNEIIRFNLISGSGKINNQFNTKDKLHFTSLGERFVKYIFAPIEFDK